MSIRLTVAPGRHSRPDVTHEVPRDSQGALREGRPARRFGARAPIVGSGAAGDERFPLGPKRFGRATACTEPGFARMAPGVAGSRSAWRFPAAPIIGGAVRPTPIVPCAAAGLASPARPMAVSLARRKACGPDGGRVNGAPVRNPLPIAGLRLVFRKFCRKREILQQIGEAIGLAIGLLLAADADLLEIVTLSLYVSLSATSIACVLGLPLGAILAVTRFPGRGPVLVLINALMGLPPVVVGLIVYLHLSRSGPLGFLGLLYTPTAMIVAQTILIAPIVVALSRQVLEDLHLEYAEQFRSLALSARQIIQALLWDGRFALFTVALAGFGRAVAEVGAVMIVGGNIDHLTRVMTTAITLETSRGNLPLALALGIVLLALAMAVTAAVHGLRAGTAGHADA